LLAKIDIVAEIAIALVTSEVLRDQESKMSKAKLKVI